MEFNAEFREIKPPHKERKATFTASTAREFIKQLSLKQPDGCHTHTVMHDGHVIYDRMGWTNAADGIFPDR